jgi:two-component sensor histidine kinase
MSIPLRILLIEDSEDDAMLLLRELRRGGYELMFERVDTPAAMLNALSSEKWQLIICDYSMPHFSAPAALKLLHESGLDLPFIIVSATIGEDIAVAAMKAGAHDYIIKSNLTRLVAAIERELREAEVRLARRRAEEQIKASLQEKEVLLKEIHHRVKNNLQIISSLLSLQAEYLKDEQAQEIFKNSQNRIESMALIHEKLYQSEDLARINLADYIRELVTNLFSIYAVNSDMVIPKFNIEDIFLEIDKAIPCGLIISELVSNSLKYAFPDGKSGKICLDLQLINDNKIALAVSDNGIGIPEKISLKNTESLGLRLVDALTKQLEGNIELKRNMGVEFKLIFPK